MHYSRNQIGKTAVYAGLAMSLTFGGCLLVAHPTVALATDVEVSNQATIEVRNATMTDPADVAGQPLLNNYDEIPNNGALLWTKTTSGRFTSYYSVKDKNGNPYYSYSSGSNNVNQFLLDLDAYDPKSLELHVVYEQGPETKNPSFHISWGSYISSENIALELDPSRNIEIKSQLGKLYSPSFGTNKHGKSGSYEKKDKYLSLGNKLEEIEAVYFNNDSIEANDRVEVVIPMIDKVDPNTRDAANTAYKYRVWDFGDWQQYYGIQLLSARKYFYRKDLQEIRLIPASYGGLTPSAQNWVPQPQLQDCFPAFDINGGVLDIIQESNFGTYAKFNANAYVGKYPKIIYNASRTRINLAEIEKKLTKEGWTVEFRANGKPAPHYTYAFNSIAAAFHNETGNNVSNNVESNKTFVIEVSVIPALIRDDAQHYKVGELPDDWSAASLLETVYKADYQTDGNDPNLKKIEDLEKYDKDAEIKDGTIKVSYEYRGAGESDDKFVTTDKVDGNKAGVYKVTFTRIYGKDTPISTYQYVYIDEVTTENKTVTRTINVYQPDGKIATTQQKVNLSCTVTTNAETGEKTTSDWKAEGTWDAYTAPQIDGWTADKTLDAQDVTADTKDATEDIFYSRPITEEKTVTRTIHLHKPDGTTQDIAQEAKLTRKGTETTTTGAETKKSWDAWSQGVWDAYVAPEFEGYKANKSIDKQEVDGNTQNTEVDITYTKLEDKGGSKTPQTEDAGKGQTGSQDTTRKPASKDKSVAGAITPKTGDAAVALAPVTATGLTALIGSIVARKRRKK